MIEHIAAAVSRPDYFDGSHFVGYAGALTALAAVGGAVAAIIRAITRNSSRRDDDEDDIHERVREARLENYSGRTDMATERLTGLIMDLSAEVKQLRQDYSRSRDDVAWLTDQVRALKLRMSRQVSAFRRRIDQLTRALQEASIPVPPIDPGDAADLADVLEDTLSPDEVRKITGEDHG